MTIRRLMAPLLSALLTAGLILATAAAARAAFGPAPRLEDVIALLAAGLAAVLGSWLTAVLVAELLARAPGTLGRMATALGDRLTPALMRQVLTLALGAGTAAVTFPAPTVAATALPPSAVVPADRSPRDLPDPGWPSHDERPPAPRPVSPDRPDPGWIPTTPERPSGDLTLLGERTQGREEDESDRLVVVRRGDTLWHIAARHLGEGATDAEIARHWPRWWAANREVIGSDPDLILPGTRLVPPSHHRDLAPQPRGRS